MSSDTERNDALAAGSGALPLLASAQPLADSEHSSGAVAITTQAHPDLTYIRPTTKMKFHSYLFDAFGPYPIAGAAFGSGIGQARNTPREWKQGAEGYSKRFGSAFGIAKVDLKMRQPIRRQ
jgi:hypothetical protein